MTSLRSACVKMNTQCCIARAVQFAVLIRIAHTIVGICVPQLRSLSKELRGVTLILEDIIPTSGFMHTP
jgi:hypothetical protein